MLRKAEELRIHGPLVKVISLYTGLGIGFIGFIWLSHSNPSLQEIFPPTKMGLLLLSIALISLVV